jgi:hypothetical protein
MPEGAYDKTALVPEFSGGFLVEIFFPDGQGEKAQNPCVNSGDDRKENPVSPGRRFHGCQFLNLKKITLAELAEITEIFQIFLN